MSLLDAFLMEPTPLRDADRRDIFFIALRADGVVGSGTHDDPWDGSTVVYPTESAALQWNDPTEEWLIWARVCPTIAMLTWPGDDAPVASDVTVDLGYAHGMVSGDAVEIAGVSPSDAARYFNGRWTIYTVGGSPTKFRYSIYTPPFGVSPFGNVTAAQIEYRFDRALRLLPTENSETPVRVSACAAHLGPGVFETRGPLAGHVDIGGGRPDAYVVGKGHKIIGSGWDVTTVKVAVTEIPMQHVNYGAFGMNHFAQRADWSEVADLTIDCNMRTRSPGYPYSKIATNAVGLRGSFTRFRRIRVIDFGTQTPGNEISAESFPIAGPGADSRFPEMVGMLVDECIVERPSINDARETTCIIAGGGRGSVIRNCVVDCRYHFPRAGGPDVIAPSQFIAITALSKVDGYLRRYRLTTAEPHHRLAGDAVTIWRIEYSGGSHKTLNGTFVIEGATEYTIDFTALRNPEEIGEPAITGASHTNAFINPVFQGPSGDGGVGTMVQFNRVFHILSANNHDTFSSYDSNYSFNYFSAVRVGIGQSINQDRDEVLRGSAIAHDGNTARFTSFSPHGLTTGDHVTVSNALTSNLASSAYNVNDVAVTKIDDYTFTYPVSGLGSGGENATSAMFVQPAGMPAARKRISAIVPGATSAEAILLSAVPHLLSLGQSFEVTGVAVNGSMDNGYNGTFTVGAVLSPFRIVYTTGSPVLAAGYEAPSFQKVISGTPAGTKFAGTQLVNDGDVATLTTMTAHQLIQGQLIFVEGALVNGGSDNPFNGYVEILEVPETPHISGKPTSLRFQMRGVPSSNATGIPQCREADRVRHLVVERNVVEVWPSLRESQGSVAIAIQGVHEFPKESSQYTPSFKRTLVRENWLRHWNSVPNSLDRLISLQGHQKATVDNNVIDLEATRIDYAFADQAMDSVKYFGNYQSTGKLRFSWNRSGSVASPRFFQRETNESRIAAVIELCL